MLGRNVVYYKGKYLKGENMTKSKFNNKSKCLKLGALLLFPMALFGGVSLAKPALDEKANALSAGYIKSHNASITLENSSFEKGSGYYTNESSISGWKAIETQSKAKGMIIDVGSGQTSEGEDGTTATFSKYKDTYMLNSNPECKDNSDSRILMINSKANINQHNIDARKGFRSSSISLSANSYYSFKVSARTMLNGDEYVSASIYLSGLKDLDGKDKKIGIENISTNSWTDYYIFVATGDEAQTVTIDLYLGSANGGKSQGAVFFDDCNVERYSENLFYDVCLKHGYNFTDNDQSFDNNTVFFTQGLKTLPSYISNHADYNFDFEDSSSEGSLGDKWEVVSQVNAHAKIMGMDDIQPADFKATTGYNYIGNDLSYENKNALVMWTGTNSNYSTSHIAIKSQDIEIKAHTAYKVSLKLKVSHMEEGAFVLKVTENDSIYSLYPSIFSNDEDSKIYYETKSGQTGGYSTNTENKWTNDYQTIQFYVRGYDLYNTSVNLELWLGDNTTNTNGCVVIDDIQVELSSSKEFSNATDKLELKSYSESSTSTIKNPYFNATEYDDINSTYPLKATNWTRETENDNYNESGVVYLGKDDEYKSMYAGKYDWAGISPAREGQTTNNVYMMFNRQNSYQSLKSESFELAKDSYYKVSFDYYNQLFSKLNPSSIKVELIDENGIILFSQDGITSLDNWNTMEIYLHTAEMVSHKVNIIIHLGEYDNKVGGIVYLDNFSMTTSSENDFLAGKYSSDLTDYFLSLKTNGAISNELTSSPAFNFAVDEIYDKGYQGSLAGAEGGIVNGQSNPYEITTENSNFLVLSTKIASKASLTSKYKFNFSADSYYKLTFDLATIFNDSAKDAGTDEHDCTYGVSIKMDGFDEINGLITEGNLNSYTIYFKCDTATEATFTFTLISDCEETVGTALLTNFNIETSNNDEYTSVGKLAEYEKSIFTSKQTESVEEEPEEDEENSSTDSANESSAWLLIPSIIMGVALLIAIIGFALRKIKIKKIEKIKTENYDRKVTLNHDAIMAEARKRRDEEVANLQKAKKLLESDKANLEIEHKEFVRESRTSSNGKLTREMEKAFKKYNSNISRLDEKINIVKEKIENVMTAEYLLSLEHKIVLEEETKFSQKKKSAKK